MARRYERYRDVFAQPSTYMVGARALEAKQALQAEGRDLSPVEPVRGRRIATTFWGQAWCRNLTRYSDYANRMPRGRSYVRYGSVVHLEVKPGEIHALVSGSDLYRVAIRIEPLARKQWDAIRSQCGGEIEAMLDLLHGKPPRRVMEIVTRPGEGLFPTPKEIRLDCSCPDWADMCKHAAAVLYGVGARLDRDPEQLFVLRSVDPNDLVSAVPEAPESGGKDALAGEDLSALFGIRLEGDDAGIASASSMKGATRRKATRKKVTRKKTAARKKVATTLRRKATRKKATRKKAARRKVAAATLRKKATRKKAARKKVAAATPGKKTTTRKKIAGGRGARRKATRKKVAVTTTRKKVTRKKVTRKKAVRKKAVTTTARKKATRKKATRKKAPA